MSIFERFLRKEPSKTPIPKILEQPPKEKPPESKFKLEDITISKSGHRIIVYIPKEIFNKIGGRDMVTKDIFSTIFKGQAMWYEEFASAFAVEIPNDTEKIEAFRREVLARALR